MGILIVYDVQQDLNIKMQSATMKEYRSNVNIKVLIKRINK